MRFLRKKTLSEESVFHFRTHSLTNVKLTMNVNWRKDWEKIPEEKYQYDDDGIIASKDELQNE